MLKNNNIHNIYIYYNFAVCVVITSSFFFFFFFFFFFNLGKKNLKRNLILHELLYYF